MTDRVTRCKTLSCGEWIDPRARTCPACQKAQ